MKFASRVPSLGGARAGAWEIHRQASDRLAAGEDVIVLSLGEAEFDTPPSIVEAAIESLRSGRTRYANAEGVTAFREAVARQHTSGTGQAITAANVVIDPLVFKPIQIQSDGRHFTALRYRYQSGRHLVPRHHSSSFDSIHVGFPMCSRFLSQDA